MSATATPQAFKALAQANRVRIARAELKRSIRVGHATVADVVAERPWFAERMTLYELLDAQLRWGRKRSIRLLRDCAIGESRQLGALTPRQRASVIEALSLETPRRNEK